MIVYPKAVAEQIHCGLAEYKIPLIPHIIGSYHDYNLQQHVKKNVKKKHRLHISAPQRS